MGASPVKAGKQGRDIYNEALRFDLDAFRVVAYQARQAEVTCTPEYEGPETDAPGQLGPDYAAFPICPPCAVQPKSNRHPSPGRDLDLAQTRPLCAFWPARPHSHALHHPGRYDVGKSARIGATAPASADVRASLRDSGPCQVSALRTNGPFGWKFHRLGMMA